MQCRLLRRLRWAPSPENQGYAEIGTLIEHPDAWMLVLNGDAEPADEECEKRTGYSRWPEERKELLLRHRERLAKGIHPEDFEAYDRGEMVGYFPDGKPIPGPNAAGAEEPDEDDCEIWLPDSCE